ncbi:hypothetical protein [Rubinisphaera italica]|uniref:Uncharacterized protein n=1 Tax=Rubinisphaera italica TaxID=2527969 RepID=A0A5C5XMW7_9PLAN|nr:hypothetical protein [Rubinisphaera italica]TWT64244.1 hypothetical protein Pan54_50050 [Rubinisphaera italica]
MLVSLIIEHDRIRYFPAHIGYELIDARQAYLVADNLDEIPKEWDQDEIEMQINQGMLVTIAHWNELDEDERQYQEECLIEVADQMGKMVVEKKPTKRKTTRKKTTKKRTSKTK